MQDRAGPPCAGRVQWIDTLLDAAADDRRDVGTQVKLDLNAIMELAGTLKDVLPLEILPPADKEELARQMRVRNFKALELSMPGPACAGL